VRPLAKLTSVFPVDSNLFYCDSVEENLALLLSWFTNVSNLLLNSFLCYPIQQVQHA
jgi:hypothetical protein